MTKLRRDLHSHGWPALVSNPVIGLCPSVPHNVYLDFKYVVGVDAKLEIPRSVFWVERIFDRKQCAMTTTHTGKLYGGSYNLRLQRFGALTCICS